MLIKTKKLSFFCFSGACFFFWVTKDQITGAILPGKSFAGRNILIQSAFFCIFSLVYFCFFSAFGFAFKRYISPVLPEKLKTLLMNSEITMFKNTENFILILVMAVFSFIFLLNSPLHPWIGSDSGTDSGVFQTVALMMEHGYMPYKDSFDHKGPLIYIINWLGNRISEDYGIWVIEFISLTIVFFLIYRIAHLKCRTSSSIIISFVSISLLFDYFGSGNFTEEYAMLFIAISLYIFLDYLINKRINRIRLVLCGLSFGSILLLRVNMISVWVVFCTLIFGKIVFEKTWGNLKQFILWFFIGVCIISIPIVIWLATNTALLACWEDYLVFNMIYTSNGDWAAKWNSYIEFLNSTIFIISFSTLAYSCKKSKDQLINISYMAYMLITLLFICISGRSYGHYGLILIPLVSYPIALLFNKIENLKDEQIANVFSTVICVYFLSTIILPTWLPLINRIPKIYTEKDRKHISVVATTISNIIKDNTSEDETISVYGNWDYIYVRSERKHATLYSYQFPIGQVMPEIMDEYFKGLKEEQPKVIVVESRRYDENDHMSNFLNNNNYDLVWSYNVDSINGAMVFVK